MTVVQIVNPLPAALAHYEVELLDLLRTTGVEVATLRTTSAERAGTDRRASMLLGVLRDRLLASPPRPGVHRLVVWPVLGFPELALWRGAAARTSVLVHDPTPLRPQVGLDARAVRTTHAVARVRPLHRLLVHSASALEVVRERGFDGIALPHPVLAPRPRSETGPGSRRVLVLGQHKDSRDLSVLADLAPLLRERGLDPIIVGRGWPDVAGWTVDSRFVTEREFQARLDEAALVLLPYTKVYQSGVAVRAAEASVPVIGGRDTNIGALYGEGWPGLLDPVRGAPDASHWLDAVDRVLALPPAAAGAHVGDYRIATLAAWRAWADALE